MSTAPPRPHARLRAGSIWPSEAGRATLREIERAAPQALGALTGQLGKNDGSGAHDLIIERCGDWCLKTSPRRRFASEDEGRAEALRIVRRKLAIERLLPPGSALALVVDARSHAWIWTISPWMTTLRATLTDAESNRDEPAIARALTSFADVASEAILIAGQRGVQLDVHPSNFGWWQGELRYLDDDLASGQGLPAIGHSLLQRVEEYGHWPHAIAAYEGHFERLIATRIAGPIVRATQLEESLRAVGERNPLVAAVKRRWLAALVRPREGT